MNLSTIQCKSSAQEIALASLNGKQLLLSSFLLFKAFLFKQANKKDSVCYLFKAHNYFSENEFIRVFWKALLQFLHLLQKVNDGTYSKSWLSMMLSGLSYRYNPSLN